MKARRVSAGIAHLAPSLRRHLYLTAAVAGAAVMIVEILGAKMIAPFFGTSHFVWTAQIAVTLVALAVGYCAGGRWADRGPQLGRLYSAILGAAAYLALTVLVARPVANRCLEFNLALGSLLASTFLFFVPLALLAMVGPFFVRVLTVDVSGVGGNVGRLTSISTLGSFAGTVLIGYALIPFLPNSTTMFLTAAVLIAVAAGYYFGWGRKRRPTAAAGGLVLASVHLSCREGVRDVIATVITPDPAHGIVLTDDYNPVEYYDAANREHFRRRTAIAMREM